MSASARDSEWVAGDVRPGHGQVFLGTGGGAPLMPRPEQVARLYRFGDPVLGELPFEPLLQELLKRAVEILDVDTAAILLYDPESHELVARAAKGLEEEVEQGVRIPLGRGFAGRIAAGRVPIFVAEVDHADILNPILREKGVRSMLGVPLTAEGQLLGVLHVGTLQPRSFTNDDAAVLQLAAARAAPAIERARLIDALEQEHRAASALQRSLLPGRLPFVIGVPVAARYLPSRDEVGGDWYDVVSLNRGSLGFGIGDVAGHGVRAAALMSELRSAMRAYALDGHSPAVLLERVDRILHTMRERGMATAAYATFDPETGVMSYATAGHPPPLLVSGAGEVRLLETDSSPPLGAMPYARFAEHDVTLEAGDTVLLYTDGLVESRGEPLREGLARLREAAAGATGPEALCAQLTGTLVPPDGGVDDIAMVAIQREPTPERLQLEMPARPNSLVEMRGALRRWLRSVDADDEDIGVIILAVGEACANAVEHAYSPTPASYGVEAFEDGGVVTVVVRDAGTWRLPRGTNRGRGLTIMENAMDHLELRHTDAGTEIVMTRRLRRGA